MSVMPTRPSSLPQAPSATWKPLREALTPRAVVELNGVRFPLLGYAITYNSHGATDVGTVTLPLAKNPDFSVWLFENQKQNQPVYATVYAGFPSNPTSGSTDISQLKQRFIGICDLYTADFAPQAYTVEFSLRSFAAPLIDTKLTDAPMGMTSVQFAQQQASRYGLTLVAQLYPGLEPITLGESLGREFVSGNSFNVALYNKRAWDVLLMTSMFDDVDVWVDGTTLYYIAPGLVKRKTVPLMYGRDLKGLSGTHSPQYNKNIEVAVKTYQARIRQSTLVQIVSDITGTIPQVMQRSKIVTSNPVFGTDKMTSSAYDPQTGMTVVTSSSSSGGGFSGSTGYASESGKERYTYYVPNLDSGRANALAQAIWRQISMLEYSVTFELPVTKALLGTVAITSQFDVSGVPLTRFNARYYPRQITETMRANAGFSWSVMAVNHKLPPGAGV